MNLRSYDELSEKDKMETVAQSCLKLWGTKNHPQSLFKIGDKVIWNNEIHKILAMNYAENDKEGNPVFEYIIDNYDWLVWDYELALWKDE